MKLNKGFLRIFLGLFVIFTFSFGVAAKDIEKEKVDKKFESFVIKFALNMEEQKGIISGRSILKKYIENDLKVGRKLTEEKFEKAKKEFLEFCIKRIREEKLLIKKSKELLEKTGTNKNEKNFKDIIKFGIEECKKSRSFLKGILKNESLTKKEKDSLKQGVDSAKKNLDYLKELKSKNRFSKGEKENLKFGLKLGIDKAKNDLKDSKKIKQEIEGLEYKDFKNDISKR